MSKPYMPGWQSVEYHRLSGLQRESIRREVDRQFRSQSGVTRQLDPTSSKDLALRRTWLRIRDEVLEQREMDELRRDLDLDGLTEIPYEMKTLGWEEAAILLQTWFRRPPAVVPNYSAPVTNVVKMDWVLQFERARLVYEGIIRNRVWTNEASRRRIAELLRSWPAPRAGQSSLFGDLSQPVATVDQQWVNSRPVSEFGIDGLGAALGRFLLQIAIAGKVNRVLQQMLLVTVDEVGVYVKDSFDFEGEEFLGGFLGVWGYRDTFVYNSDFRQWRLKNNAGGDFRVFSDIKRTKLNPPDQVFIT